MTHTPPTLHVTPLGPAIGARVSGLAQPVAALAGPAGGADGRARLSQELFGPPHRFARTPAERERWEAARNQHPPRLHPVVRTHPEGGAQVLFVDEGFTTRIVELSASGSEAVLRHVAHHIAKPEHTVRWRWKLGDVAFWDNRLTQHYATADYLPARRVMHRATLLGDQPFYRASA